MKRLMSCVLIFTIELMALRTKQDANVCMCLSSTGEEKSTNNAPHLNHHAKESITTKTGLNNAGVNCESDLKLFHHPHQSEQVLSGEDVLLEVQNGKLDSQLFTDHNESRKILNCSTLLCSDQCRLKDSDRTEEDSFKLQQLHVPYSLTNEAYIYENLDWVFWMSSFTNFTGEQFNSQRRSLLELMFLIRTYAPQRGLVEPLFVFNPHNSSLYEHLYVEDPDLLGRLSDSNAEEQFTWRNMTFKTSLGIFASPAGALLDMMTFSKFNEYPILPFEAFKRLSNSTLDQLLIAEPRLTGLAPSLDCDRRVLNVSAEFFGSEWNFQAFHCMLIDEESDEDSTILFEFASAVEENDVKNLGVVYARRRLVEDGHQFDDVDMQYFRLRAFLRWSTSVLIVALKFIQTQFFSQPFLGVHWRRGDRLVYVARYRDTDWTLSVDKHSLVIQTLHACKQHNLSDVYLMTNCGSQKDLSYIISKLKQKGIMVKMSNLFSRWQDEDKHLAVESAIMSFAEFVLISSSTVSGTILEERILLGYSLYSFNNLVPLKGFAEEYFRLAEQIERELASYPDLQRAINSAHGLGRNTVMCLLHSTPADCAVRVIESSRFIAQQLSYSKGQEDFDDR